MCVCDYLLCGKSFPAAVINDRSTTKFGLTTEKVGRKRGRRGGVRRRIRQQLHRNRIPLPSMVLSNVQSIRDKTDELQTNAGHLRVFRNACVMAFTETWLTDMESDSSMDINGFGPPVLPDRDGVVTGRTQGGGVCL